MWVLGLRGEVWAWSVESPTWICDWKPLEDEIVPDRDRIKGCGMNPKKALCLNSVASLRQMSWLIGLGVLYNNFHLARACRFQV